LFQIALKKIIDLKSSSDLELGPKTLVEGSKEAICLEILKNGRHIRADELFSAIWGYEAQAKNEMARLRKLRSRIKNKTDIDVISYKGCYFIQANENKKIAS